MLYGYSITGCHLLILYYIENIFSTRMSKLTSALEKRLAKWLTIYKKAERQHYLGCVLGHWYSVIGFRVFAVQDHVVHVEHYINNIMHFLIYKTMH